MGETFAFIEYGDIPEKPSGSNPPFRLEIADIAGEKGYRVLLPVTEKEAGADRTLAVELFDKAVNELRSYNVDIILPPKSISAQAVLASGAMPVANGMQLFPFFLVKCLKRIYKKTRGSQDISRVNVLITGSSPKLAELTVNCLAEDVGYLTVVIPEYAKHSETEWLYSLSDDLLFETGAALGILESGRDAYQNADVIINLKKEADRYEHVYKKNAVFADMSQNESRLWDISRRRADVTVFDGIRIRLGQPPADICMTLPVFELFFYVKSPAYRKFTAKNVYDPLLAVQVKKSLDRLNPRVSALYKLNKVIM